MFSIITPTYNRAPVLERTLAAMLAMEGVENCEIIVVDDGSTDETSELLARLAGEYPDLIRSARQENGGPGEARNAGLRLVRHNRILFIDDDVFPDPGLLQAHAELLDRGFDLSQGVLNWHPELADNWVMRHMDRHGMQFVFDLVGDEADLSYLHVYTANLAVTKEAIDAVGGFDASFAGMRYAFEDTAFAYRIKESGRTMALNRRARGLHYHPITAESLAAREYKVGYGLGILRERYPRIAQDMGITPSGPIYALITHLVGLVLRIPITGLLGNELRLRFACREAFAKGLCDYEKLSS